MHVIGHQYIGMDAATCLGGMLRQPFKIDAVILVREEAGLPVIAALNQMLGNARQRKARTARHSDGPLEKEWPNTIRKP